MSYHPTVMASTVSVIVPALIYVLCDVVVLGCLMMVVVLLVLLVCVGVVLLLLCVVCCVVVVRRRLVYPHVVPASDLALFQNWEAQISGFISKTGDAKPVSAMHVSHTSMSHVAWTCIPHSTFHPTCTTEQVVRTVHRHSHSHGHSRSNPATST